ncbi:sulfite exporter TauE/SafE family protein [Thermostichus vulcanus]|uniref:Probable membrane transporter protein n=1 Tax=Thermostichus vulcanus str. 'Rupite' TaxID=2813851 RepID=A0ABT0CDM7_THEVL|nr:sulfite exporter TauE/SafE family protein [Thermostichus vulcanus]MCJ2543888.1 sulfite exporter TauE/SafE family protein [Thermostichus vulcanus str. 'Rupite']
MVENGLALGVGGLLAGILAGFLGIGGGTILVPLQVSLGIPPIQAVATSNLSIVMTSIAGSVQNWRMGLLDLKRVILLGIPALITAQVGAMIASRIPGYLLLAAFGVLLLVNTYLVELRKKVASQAQLLEKQVAAENSAENSASPIEGLGLGEGPQGIPLPSAREPMPAWLARTLTGGTAGLLAGLFGIGGGVIMVPMQILLLQETIKVAIQTSLGAIVITAIAATTSHAGLSDLIWNGLGWGDGTLRQNVLWIPGLILGTGGLIGVQISTRTLPKLPDKTVSLLFRGFLAILSLYIFWQAWQDYQAS